MDNHPRIGPVKKLLKNARILERQTKMLIEKIPLQERFSMDNSTSEEMTQVIGYFINKDRSEHYRNVLMFLLSHHHLLRDENLRDLELADIQTLSLAGEGPTSYIEYHALVMLLDHGKTNIFGKTQYGSCIRNDEVKICPWMALSFYLFHRWNIKGECFPEMTKTRG